MSGVSETDSKEPESRNAGRKDIERAIKLSEAVGMQLRRLYDSDCVPAGAVSELFTSIEELLGIARLLLIRSDTTILRIPEKRRYTFKEIAETLGVGSLALRYWAKEFRVGKPDSTVRGRVVHPMYRRKDLEEFLTVKRLLHQEGFTITGAKRCLRKMRKRESGKKETLRSQKTPSTEVSRPGEHRRWPTAGRIPDER
jgi:DNA-binding transcriptional MerR regulator